MEAPDMTSVPPLFEVEVISSPMARVRGLSNYEGSLRTRSEDVNDTTEVGISSPEVVDVDGADSDGLRDTGWGKAASVRVSITGANDDNNPKSNQPTDSIIDQ